ncbi:YceI family protein, partial [Candidatus Omnitrophota bacterium]
NHRKKLDRNMYRMFESQKYPQAHCRVESMVFKGAETGADQPTSAIIKAVLTLKEVAQPFESEVTVMPAEGGFIVAGNTIVSLKAFELKPPTILGFIKMRDELTVNFDILVRRETQHDTKKAD